MSPRSVIVTVAFGHSTENLDYTFASFAEKNPGVPLHAFIIGRELPTPTRQLKSIKYHLVEPVPDFSHPLREVYFRRLELIDQLEADYALVVDSYDVLCLQPLPPFEKILSGSDVAACVEHMGARYVMGQGYTANFLNGGVFFWNIAGSRDIRTEIVARGKSNFRKRADDQYVINEVIQTKYYDRLRILPCQYNYRAYLNEKQGGWPTVTHLDGVLIYHNGPSIEKWGDRLKSREHAPKAELPPLIPDGRPLNEDEQFLRALLECRKKHIVRESLGFQLMQRLLGWKFVNTLIRLTWPMVRLLRLDKLILRILPIG